MIALALSTRSAYDQALEAAKAPEAEREQHLVALENIINHVEQQPETPTGDKAFLRFLLKRVRTEALKHPIMTEILLSKKHTPEKKIYSLVKDLREKTADNLNQSLAA